MMIDSDSTNQNELKIETKDYLYPYIGFVNMHAGKVENLRKLEK